MKRQLTRTLSPRLAAVLAIGVALSVALLGGYGYRAIREWQYNATLLAERRAQEAADLLATALTRDMRAAQLTVLSSQDWDEVMLDPPYHVTQLVASAFARYPYTESFFSWRGGAAPDSAVFFTRSDRPPAWLPSRMEHDLFPVVVSDEPAAAAKLADRVEMDARQEHRFSIFDLRIDETTYQVVARLQYGDPYRLRLKRVFGFMVNLDWVKEHYLSEVANEVERITRPDFDLHLTVVREAGATAEPEGTLGRRAFPILFFNPLSLALNAPPDLVRENWIAQARVADRTLLAAATGARRTLAVAAIAGLVFAVGLGLTVSVVRTNALLLKRRAEFVASVTHELKTPVAAIRAAGETLIAGRLTSPEASREYIQLVVDQAKRLSRLLEDLLAYARITDETDAYVFRPVALKSVVDESLRGFRWQLDQRGFHVEIDIPPGLPRVRADQTALGLLLDSLIDNAIAYSSSTPWLRIAASPAPGVVIIEVADRGIGIPQEEIAHVTKKFYRGRQTGSSGSGLGLAIAERIAVDHGGALSIRSSVGEGTTVLVTLLADRETL